MTPPARPPLHRRILARLRSLWRGVRHRTRIEDEMQEEFRVHLEMRTDDLVAQGMDRKEAARRARLEFGHVETHRERARAARGLRWVDELRFSWIDLRLGVRMLFKYPGLTLVAALALAIGIPVGLGPVHMAEALDRPLPEDTDDRIRAIRYWNPMNGVMEMPTYGDLTLFSSELAAFSRLGAYRNGSYTVGPYDVGSGDARSAPVSGAEVTATALSMLGVAPLMGRLLDRADETPGAADVVVIGERLWQTRFGGDADVVGATVRVGSAPHTVVGVMPASFRFPFADQLWLPLRGDASAEPGQGRTVRVVGRLADGVTDEVAQAEIASIALPPTHPALQGAARQQLEIVPFSYTYVGLPRAGFAALPEFHFMRLLGGVLLLVACANVAMLVFARTATRFRELAVRTALGAGRGRIVGQVFLETLVLAVLAGGAGLLLVDQLVAHVPWRVAVGEAAIPYWLDLGVPAAVLPWAALLTVLSATVAGVIPALRVTRGDVHTSIRNAEAGRSGIRFGGGTSALIVADVAIAVGVIGFAFGISRYMNELADSEAHAGIAAEEYLAVELRLSANDVLPGEIGGASADGAAARGAAAEGAATAAGEAREATRGSSDARPIARLARIQEQLGERLAAEPDVRAVVFADALPRQNHRSRVVWVDGRTGGGEDEGTWARVARVDVDFFEELGAPVLLGRDFDRADLDAETSPVIVNRAFVDRVLGGEEPVGRRVRLSSDPDDRNAPWHEIVGVVGRLGMNTVSREGAAGLYVVQPAGSIHPVQVGIHVGAAPERFVPRLREIVAETDPAAMLGTPVVLATVQQGDWYIAMIMTAGMGLLVAILVALAASGIYAMMSFSVSQRTREIGIRSALGAGRSVLVVTILRRTLGQLGVGALLGIPLATWFLLQIQDPNAESWVVAGAVARAIAVGLVTTSVIGVLSCVTPVRRALAIEANDALRAE